MRPNFLSLLKADLSREQLEDWCRSQTQSYPITGMAGGYIVCRVLGKYILFVVARDNAITPHLVLSGIWEPWITMAIARHVKPGMRCMDVGACYGYYSVLMADIVGSAGYVEAWEPVWSNVLERNIAANGVTVSAHHEAMGTQEGAQFQFRLPEYTFNAGDVRLEPRNPKLVHDTAAVYMRAPAASTFDFIKIDVEGAEADVWQALAEVRAASPRLTVCMEFTPGKHADPKAFVEMLMNDGFALGTVDYDGVPRPCSLETALVPNTGDFRMLWLTRTK